MEFKIAKQCFALLAIAFFLANFITKAQERKKDKFLIGHSQSCANTTVGEPQKEVVNFCSFHLSLSKSKVKTLLSSSPSWLVTLLILNSGDVQQHPGPRHPKFPCGICCKACTRKTSAVACDSCDIWYHTMCMQMNSKVYTGLRNVSWECFRCGIPNFNSSLFSSFEDSINTTNKFENLPPEEPNFQPDHCSTPKKPTKNRTTNQQETRKDPKIDKEKKTTANKKTLKILTINFQSLWNKREELVTICEETNPDIIIGCETWLGSDIKDSELLIDDRYDLYRRERGQTISHGGVIMAVKKEIRSEIIQKGKTNESIFVKIGIKGKEEIFGAIYRPPNSSWETNESLVKDFYEIKKKFRNRRITIAGDFNLPDIDWQNYTVNGHQYEKKVNELYLTCFSELGLEQTNKMPTRLKSILEIYLTNNPDRILKSETVPGLGDHESALQTTYQTYLPRRKPLKRNIYLWNKANEESIRNNCRQFSQLFLKHHSAADDVNQLWKCIKTNLKTIINDNVPTKTTSANFTKPWVTTEVKRIIRKKQKWFKKMKNCKSERVKEKYLNIKKECQRKCRNAHSNFINDLASEDQFNKKKFFMYIKGKQNGTSNGVSELKDNVGKVHQDPKVKATMLNDQFCSVFSDPSKEPAKIHESKRIPTMNNIKVNIRGVEKLMANINPNKATGPDEIPGKVLKLGAKELAPTLSMLFQASLDQGKVPDDWKAANIVPLFKKGDKTCPENYRPVSLTSITCKLLEHIVHSTIMDHFEANQILIEVQHGFRQKRSCETQLITTCSDFIQNIEKKSQTDAILLDFSKAFDKVHHGSLLNKLEFYGIRNNTYLWIKSFLSERTQKVLVDGTESPLRSVKSGVPQGTVLGPLLFLTYINDMPNGLSEGTKLRLFADDSLLYREIRTERDSKILQEDLNKLQEWERNWQMEFHPQKCQVLRITNKTKPITADYFIHECKLGTEDHAKYLGITLDGKMTWTTHINNTCTKANKALGFIKRHLSSCPPKVKQQCYESYVRPIVEYSGTVWDPHQIGDIKKIEKIQRSAARFVTNQYDYNTPSSKILKELDWVPLEERRARSKVTLIKRAELDLVKIPTEDLKLKKNNTRRAAHSYELPRSRTNSHLHSFFPSSIRLWNNLPNNIREIKTIDTFKLNLQGVTLRSNYVEDRRI